MLLGGDTLEHYRRAVAQGAERVASRFERVDGPFSGVSPEQLAPTIAGIDLDAPVAGLDEALDEIERIYLRDAVYFHHPRYLAHLNCPVAIPALLAETILAPLNSSLDTWDQSAGGTLIERRLIGDVAEEVVLMDPDRRLPPGVERIRAEVPDELKPLSIQTDVFDCFLRFLDAILDIDLWPLVADCVSDYEASVPELAGRYDLFADTFALSCLNRLQLRNSRQMVDLQDPAGSLQFAGTLDNPLATRLRA